jgi:dienelactone hydrolase
MQAVWAAEGYAVLQPNYRGSSGYGNAFAVAIRRDLGGGDFRDILAGIDALAERGIVDPQRVGIMGASYGGYLANWAACTSDRFAAAISMFGVFNLITSTGSSDIARWERDYLGAYYWEDPEIYRRLSPASYVGQAKTPVLIIHGEGDTNTFVSNSIEMWRALKERGQIVEFARYPREGHGLREPNHRIDELRRCLAWFDRFVKGAGAERGTYRVGDRIEAKGGYELRVLHAEDGFYAGWNESRGRVIEVAIALSGSEPTTEPWDFFLDEVTLENPAGKRLRPRGIAADVGGGRYLVEGRGQRVRLAPDRETGLLSVALAVAFVVPRRGGRYLLRVGSFAPVAVQIGPEPPDPRPAA